MILVIGWFGALFTGQLPGFAASYLSSVLRWQGRVTGYQFLLTDKYPPFSFEDSDYPIRVAMRPGSLNRLAVLFRYFLLIPAAIVSLFVVCGVLVTSIVAWLIVLIMGRMPDSLQQALGATLRYQVRLSGFAYMLTSEYPAGLYGDQPGAIAGTLGWSPPPAAEAYGTPGMGSWTVPGPPPWPMVLSRKARNLVTVILLVGLPGTAVAGLITALFVSQHTPHHTSGPVTAQAGAQVVTKQEAILRLTKAAATLTKATTAYAQFESSCARGDLQCVHNGDKTVAAAFGSMLRTEQAMIMPTAASRQASAKVIGDLRNAQAYFLKLSVTPRSQYVAQSRKAESVVGPFAPDYEQLGHTLSS